MKAFIIIYSIIILLLLGIHFFLERKKVKVSNGLAKDIHALLSCKSIIGMNKEQLLAQIPISPKQCEDTFWVYRYEHYCSPWVMGHHVLLLTFEQGVVTSFESIA